MLRLGLPPTSTGSSTSSFHPEIELNGQRTRVLLEQVQAVDPDQPLAGPVGQVSADEQ